MSIRAAVTSVFPVFENQGSPLPVATVVWTEQVLLLSGNS